MLLFHAQGKTNSDGSVVNFTVESKQGVVSVKAIVPTKNSPPELRTYQCRSRVITVDKVFHELRSEFQVHDIVKTINGSDRSDVAGFIGGLNPVRGFRED